MKLVICKHRDCSIEFTPDKTRWKFCCKDCYRLERTKALNEKNYVPKLDHEQEVKRLEKRAKRGDTIALIKLKKIREEKSIRIAREKEELKFAVEQHFGEPVRSYSTEEIADFLGTTKSSIDGTLSRALDKIRANKKFEENFWD